MVGFLYPNRSPGTGLYDNLSKYDLPYAEAIFDLDYFNGDPRAFFALAKDLYHERRYKPNIVHHFVKLLSDKAVLQKMYTQNIDGLERGTLTIVFYKRHLGITVLEYGLSVLY